MSTRVQDVLLALLAAAAIALSVAVLRPPQTPDSTALLGAAVPRIAAATAAPSPSASSARPGRPVAASNGRPAPVVAFAGDSYVGGVGATRPGASGYVPLLAQRLGWATTAVGLPGAGYLEAAPGATVLDAIRQLDLPSLAPDLVVLQAGHNDVTLPLAQLQARVTAAVLAVRQQVPAAQVDVVGILWPGTPPAAAPAADAAIRAGAQAAGALFTSTLDLRFPAVAAANRPTDAGHAAIAVRLQSSFRDLGLLP